MLISKVFYVIQTCGPTGHGSNHDNFKTFPFPGNSFLFFSRKNEHQLWGDFLDTVNLCMIMSITLPQRSVHFWTLLWHFPFLFSDVSSTLWSQILLQILSLDF